MTTFVGIFTVIERVLPHLYRWQIVAEYDELMDELQRELANELQNELAAEFKYLQNRPMPDRREVLAQMNWYEAYCRAEGDWWDSYQNWDWIHVTLVEEDDECFEIFAEILAFMQNIPAWDAPIFWENIEWFNLRQMREHYEEYGSNAYLIARNIIENFAMTNNVRVIVWEIPPWTHDLGEILIEVEGRSAELDFMTAMGATEAAVRQQNYFDIQTGGFAIAISGTFQPAYRVLNILNDLGRPLIAGLFVLAFGIAFFFSFYLARPIVKVSNQSKELRELKFGNELRLNRRDEIGELSGNLNYMSYKLKNALDDLQDANEKLKAEMEREREQERQRRNMFTSISHELKTPITILKGEIGGMIDGVGDYHNRDKYLESTYGWVESLEKLVGEILTITRLEGEQMSLDLQPVDLAAMLLEITKTYQPIADQQGVNVVVDLKDNLITYADRTQLQLAFSNVINNAIFYTPTGEQVTISLRQVGKYLIVEITNAGIHIATEDLQNIFNPFYRVDKSRNRHTGGSGLGLFIVKNILELHEFGYQMENTNEGVKFMIKMPIS